MRRQLVALLALSALAGCQHNAHTPPEKNATPRATTAPQENELALQGRRLFEKTYEKLPGVQSKLHCSSCHLQGGTAEGAAALVGVAEHYTGDTALWQRVNGCVENNLNGPPLSQDSSEMKAFLAYLEGLHQDPAPARGLKMLEPPAQSPDAERGQALFAMKCQDCHQADGSGNYSDKKYEFPAIWGDHSFTSGSALAKSENLAAFIMAKMPQGQDESLTEQEAWDIATYLTGKPRPRSRPQ